MPLETTEASLINAVTIMQIDSLPITVSQLQKATKEDRILCKITDYLFTGNWPNEQLISDDIKPFYVKRNELSLHDGVVMWGLRVVIPFKYRSRIL